AILVANVDSHARDTGIDDRFGRTTELLTRRSRHRRSHSQQQQRGTRTKPEETTHAAPSDRRPRAARCVDHHCPAAHMTPPLSRRGPALTDPTISHPGCPFKRSDFTSQIERYCAEWYAAPPRHVSVTSSRQRSWGVDVPLPPQSRVWVWGLLVVSARGSWLPRRMLSADCLRIRRP